MRLKKVFISDYKNLKDFELKFDDDNFLDIFVGKNGTGKSNLFEALIEIFRHLYEGLKYPPLFDYLIGYTIGDTEVLIEWAEGQLRINGTDRKTLGKTLLPENILVYYSGHNRTITKLIDSYTAAFQSRIKSAKLNQSPKFIGIGPNHKELLLSALLLQPEGSVARNYIEKKLDITSTSNRAQLLLKRPTFAGKNSIEDFDQRTHYWGAEGITHTFLLRLQNCIKGDFQHRDIYEKDTDTYTLTLDKELFEQEFSEDSRGIFNDLHNLKMLGMLERISVPLTTMGSSDANIDHFSDGQFQSVYIYAITELFKTKHCLTLLDEPDSFLHPEWQYEFLDQVFEISDAAAETNHTLLSSHSAVTLIPHKEDKVRFFEITKGKPHCFPLPKHVAIKKLSSDLIKYSEQEQLLSIVNAIQIENKPVLFTEGSTDPIIIKEAWNKLYEEDIPFIPFYAFSCSFINNLLTDERIQLEMGGLPVFGLFDLDQAYNHWNGLNGEVLSDDPFTGMRKKWASGDSYALVIPVPDNEDIKKQSIKDEAAKETFKGDSACEIEHLFYGYSATDSYFETRPCPGGERIEFISDTKKTEFAKEVIPLLDKEAFKILEPLFTFIKSKCPAPAPSH